MGSVSNSALRQRYLQAMGISVWQRRALEPARETRVMVPLPAQLAVPDASHDAWSVLEQSVKACQKCALHATRKQTVFGVGNRRAQWMFVGEAPGADEDAQGEPFVGRAGQLLNSMLFALGLKREEVYIANVLKCLRYNAQVQLGDGSWERIGRLVRSQYNGTVMSIDTTGRLVPRRVTGWHESPLGGRRVFRLTYRTAKNAGKSRVSVQLTGDHEVLTRRGFVPVEKLCAHDQIATGQGLSPLAFDVVCGTLLGDGYIAPDRTMLTFSHSQRQYDYAMFKAELLKELEPQATSLAVAAVAGGEKTYPAVHVRTLATRSLRTLRKEFYCSRKQVPEWMETKLNSRMLAIWFLDDGYVRIRPNRQPLAEIATCGFKNEDLLILLKGLGNLGLNAKAMRGRLYFDVAATRALSIMIAPFVPPSMRYKLHPEVESRVPFDAGLFAAGEPVTQYDDIEVEDVTDVPRSDMTFFCIDVEENHNFVTAGGVVHNCRPPGNRDPQPGEVEQCEPYLIRQIELIQPKLIVALGRHAAHSLLKTDLPLARLRAQSLRYQGIPLVVTYHPAYLLRTPGDKRKAWDDLCRARQLVTQP